MFCCVLIGAVLGQPLLLGWAACPRACGEGRAIGSRLPRSRAAIIAAIALFELLLGGLAAGAYAVEARGLAQAGAAPLSHWHICRVLGG